MPIHPNAKTLVACMTCGTEKHFELTFEQLSDLIRNGQLKLFCPSCRTFASWYGLEPDRRAGTERRDSRHARIEMPIRVRCESPGLNFTEVTITKTASRHGASFTSTHELMEGMMLFVVVPYSKEDLAQLEMGARVVRVSPRGGEYEIGVEFLT
jgi:PilZ domain